MKNSKYMNIGSVVFGFLLMATGPLQASANDTGTNLKFKTDVGDTLHTSIQNKTNINNKEYLENDSAIETDKNIEKNDLDEDRGSATTTKDKEVRKNDEREATSTEPVEKGDGKNHCFKAFGHFIAPGFIKTHGHDNDEFKCDGPFGIRWNLWSNRDNNSVATTSPIIIGLHIGAVSSTTATVNWKTFVASDTKIYYSIDNPVVIGATSTSIMASSGLVTDHSLTLTGLATSTKYYVIVKSTNATNETWTAEEFKFTTRGK